MPVTLGSCLGPIMALEMWLDAALTFVIAPYSSPRTALNLVSRGEKPISRAAKY